MKTIPRVDDAGPDDFLPIDTTHVPPIMAATDKYSLNEYLAPPKSREPIMTGTILPDFARVTTGNDTPLARAKEVNAFAQTCVAPLNANMSWGSPFVPPVSSRPAPPIMTLAIASAKMVRLWYDQNV